MKNKIEIMKIKNWLVTPIGIRVITLSLLVLFSIFVPYIFAIFFGFSEIEQPWFGIWIMGFFPLILTIIVFMFATIIILGSISYVIGGEFAPLGLLNDIWYWLEGKIKDKLDKLRSNEN